MKHSSQQNLKRGNGIRLLVQSFSKKTWGILSIVITFAVIITSTVAFAGFQWNTETSTTAIIDPSLPYYERFMQEHYDKTTTFEQRKQAFLTDNGAYFADDHPFQAVWAWLENNDPRKSQGIQMLLDDWSQETEAGSAAAMRAMLHPNTSAADREKIQQKYMQEVEATENGEGIFRGANLNQGIQRAVGLYLFLQEHPEENISDILYTYLDGDRTFKDFCFDNRCYERGSHYDLFQLLEDYIQYRYEWYVKDDFSSNEFDVGAYTWTYVEAAVLVHDLVDETPLRRYTTAEMMRAKSKMIIDFLLLDIGMEFSANQWGGAKGAREYYSYWTRKGDITAQQCIFLGLGCAFSAPYKPYYDIYLSDYRAPDVILDVTDISDEPDQYWHQHMEYNGSASREGKVTFVTKFYNLGSGFDYSWVLNVKSDAVNGDGVYIGVPFRLWTRDEPIHDNVRDYAYPEMVPGGSNMLYRNAVASRESDQNLHMFTALYQEGEGAYEQRLQQWDSYTVEGDRHFFQEGRTMVILELDGGGSFLEVAIQGVHYPDMEAFKAAFVGGSTTSYGDTLSRSGSTGEVLVNGSPAYEYPFDRLETLDYQGNYIIEWDQKVMTVSKHGRTCTYDFNTWTYDGDCGAAAPPPTCDPDINKDGLRNVLDVQEMVNALLEGNPSRLCIDINSDGNESGQDLQMLVEIVLSD